MDGALQMSYVFYLAHISPQRLDRSCLLEVRRVRWWCPRSVIKPKHGSRSGMHETGESVYFWTGRLARQINEHKPSVNRAVDEERLQRSGHVAILIPRGPNWMRRHSTKVPFSKALKGTLWSFLVNKQQLCCFSVSNQNQTCVWDLKMC